MPRREVVLPGAHGASAVVMAALVARALGVSNAKIRTAVRAYRGLPGRFENLGKHQGLWFVNDTTATSPDAVQAALLSAQERWPKSKVVLIAGGADKDIPALAFANVRTLIQRRCRGVVLFAGAGSEKFGHLKTPTVRNVRSMADAVGLAKNMARPGDVVLLSPGASSFGIFQHEFDRGDQFCALVKKL